MKTSPSREALVTPRRSSAGGTCQRSAAVLSRSEAGYSTTRLIPSLFVPSNLRLVSALTQET
jgi:hypothetical protein